ncbi:MAG: lysophospholipid acyltransferase family protein [Candidatus Zixiibacteriota bacterium]
MAKLSHHVEYLATRFGIAVANLLSPRAADRLGAGLGDLAYLMLTSRQRIAMENLRRAFGDRYSEPELQQITRRVFQNIGRTLVEFARFGKIKAEGARSLVAGDLTGVEQARAKGNGGIIVTAHFGNWELLGAWFGAMGYPMDFLVGRQHNQKVDDLLIGFRREMGVGIIPLATSTRQVFKALKANRITGLVSDQHASSGGVRLEFFGRPAATPRGPALFAIRANCPLLPYMLRRESFDRHVAMAGEPIYPPNSGDEEADIRTMTEQYTGFFENCIRQFPDQWMWTHRRWKL